MELKEIPTPAFLVDLPLLRRNLEFMKARAQQLGVKLRPHTKTHKTREIAGMQVDDSRAITVSTLAEAEFYLEDGFTDILYAVPLFPGKIRRAADLIRRGADMKIIIDNPAMIDSLEKGLPAILKPLKTMIKIDCGYERAGLPADSESALRMALKIEESKKLEFEGILTHAGHSYAAKNREEIMKAAIEEKESLNFFSRKLKSSGIPCPLTSIGSTPTSTHADDLEGISEIRPGCYVFLDKFQADIGTSPIENCAATIMAGIIGTYPDRNQVLLDAGALALDQPRTFGLIRENPDMFVSSLSQEHGIVTSRKPIDFTRFRIGDRLSVIPNHCCLAAALFPEYHVVEGEKVTGIWKPAKGW